MVRPALLEPEAQVPEIYRNTPFEFAQTAEAAQILVTCGKPIPSARPWGGKVGTVEIKPPLPKWMTPPQGRGSDQTSR
jgi:hypothetical protein